MEIFKGSGVALVTPFKNGEIDYKSLENLIEFQISNETDAIIICGTTGEASTLSYEEQINCIKFCVEKVNKRIPVIAGTGSNCTKSAVKMAQAAEKIGVDGLLIVTPYYNKATQRGLVEHYSKIASSVTLPIIMYNVPSRTGCNIEPKTAVAIAKNIDNIVGIKEASGNIVQVAQLAYLIKKEKVKLDIYSGNDDQVYDLLEIGGKGVISVNANIIPKQTHDLVWNFMNGNKEKSKELQHQANEYAKVLFSEVNPIPIKRATYELGLISSPELRLPLTDLEEKNVKKLQILLKKQEN